MFDKKVQCYEKKSKQFSKFRMLKGNHDSFHSHVTSNEVWTSTGTREVITYRI